ncbi:hypothetical protein WA1_22205 [Scytonema hofmannii PCC 7110]|uniref:Uncharacterized protein n=2 Tax=Scytonema hofmannii TaxID=34078 RepID=A0A139X9P6_9CYAN|nr:hypothetical protein WA1_22205 [Scytonema hofmannii PCC 7110]
MIAALRGKPCEVLAFTAKIIKAINSINYNEIGIGTDFDPITIILKLTAMPHDVIADLHTRLKRFSEFPDANYRITKRLQEVGLM